MKLLQYFKSEDDAYTAVHAKVHGDQTILYFVSCSAIDSFVDGVLRITRLELNFGCSIKSPASG